MECLIIESSGILSETGAFASGSSERPFPFLLSSLTVLAILKSQPQSTVFLSRLNPTQLRYFCILYLCGISFQPNSSVWNKTRSSGML